jgi:ABC-type transport system involved in multi-copper enzyme maturation permease subunit
VKRLLANVTLARDVLVRTARQRLMGIYLVLGTAVVCVLVFGAEVLPVAGASQPAWRLEFFGQSPWQTMGGPEKTATPALVLMHYWVVLLPLGALSLIGVGMGLLATLTSVSSAFEPGRAELVLPRPTSRGEVVLSRFAGALAFGLLQGLWIGFLLFFLTGFKFGFWWPELLLLGFALLPKFAVVLAVGTVVLVWTRSRALSLTAVSFAWLSSYLINSLRQSIAEARAAGASSPLLDFEGPVTWAQRLIPQIPHQDFLPASLFMQSLDASTLSEGFVLAQAAAWVVLPLAITVWVVSRRDY